MQTQLWKLSSLEAISMWLSQRILEIGNRVLHGFCCHSFLCQGRKTVKTLYSERLSKQESGKPMVGFIDLVTLKNLTLENRGSELVLRESIWNYSVWCEGTYILTNNVYSVDQMADNSCHSSVLQPDRVIWVVIYISVLILEYFSHPFLQYSKNFRCR